MGDGGVACVPSLRFSISETFCGGNDGGKFNIKVTEDKVNMKLARRDKFPLKTGESCDDSEELSVDEREEKVVGNGHKEEVEEGELGEWEHGEFVPEKPRRFEIKSEIEKGEFVADRWRKGEVEKGEFVPGKWRKGGLQSGDYSSRRREFENSEFGLPKGGKDEVEKGEFIPDRWQRSELARDDNNYLKTRRYDSAKDKGWKMERGRTPSSGKYSGEKDCNRNGNQYTKKPARWENNSRERTPRISSKIVDEEGLLKDEYSNGKSHAREFPLGNRLKRHSVHSDKHHGEFNDYAPYKSRRISDDGSRSP